MRLFLTLLLSWIIAQPLASAQTSPFDQSAYNRRKRNHENRARNRSCKDGVRETNDLVLNATRSVSGFFQRYLEVGSCGGGPSSTRVKFLLEDGRTCELDIYEHATDTNGYPIPDCQE